MDQDTTSQKPRSLTFRASRGRFLLILIVNLLLTIATLGIYRFWARTKVRRYLWQSVRFLDDPLEYTGTGGELFIGFLIVVAVLFPLGLLYSAIGAAVPPEETTLRIALEVAYYTVLFALLQIGFYRMWRYRMSRTVWRGVRFGLDGSTWTYLKLATGWTVLTVLTLGLAFPWMKVDLWRYQVRHTRLGGDAFTFTGAARILFASWLAVIVPALAAIATVAYLYFRLETDPNLPYSIQTNPSAHADVWGAAAGAALAAIIAGVAYFLYWVRQVRLQISGLSFRGAIFRSRLPTGRLILFAAFSFISYLIVLILFFGPVLTLGGPNDPIPQLFALFMAVLIAVIAWPLLVSALFGFEVIKQTVLTTDISSPEVLERAAQSSLDAPRTGEGLADALDIGGF